VARGIKRSTIEPDALDVVVATGAPSQGRHCHFD
jgi:hypothetical protein